MKFVQPYFIWLCVFFSLGIAYGSERDETCPPCSKKGIMDCIEERGICAGVKEKTKPLGWKDGDVWKGFDVELVRAFAQCWLNDPTKVTFVPVTSDNRQTLLEGRKIDFIAASMSRTVERADITDFSVPYFWTNQTVLINRESAIGKKIEANDIDSTSEFCDKKIENILYEEKPFIYVVGGANAGSNFTTEAQKCKIIECNEKKDGQRECFWFKDNSRVIFRTFLSYEEATTDIRNKANNGILITDKVILDAYAKEDDNLRVVIKPFTTEMYGVGIYPGEKRFQQIVDMTLWKLWENGTYQQIYAEEIGGTPPSKFVIVPSFDPKDFQTYLEHCPMPEPTEMPSSPQTCDFNMEHVLVENQHICMDRHEVTNREYCEQLGKKCDLEQDKSVTKISWNDAQAYCEKMGKRLPTVKELTMASEHPGSLNGLTERPQEWAVLEGEGGDKKTFFPPDKKGGKPVDVSPADKAYPNIGFRCANSLE